MHRRLFSRLCLAFVLVLWAATAAASTPAACTGTHCVYLPLVSTPELVVVSNVQSKVLKYSQDLSIEGEVTAVTSTPVYSVTLEVHSYDIEGDLIGIVTGRPELVATLPGQPNPFRFWSGATRDQFPERFEVRVTGFSRTHPRIFLPVRVAITSYQYNGGSISLKLMGTLTNENTVPLEDIRGAAWSSYWYYGYWPTFDTYAPRLEPSESLFKKG